jgi:hypothetical protein
MAKHSLVTMAILALITIVVALHVPLAECRTRRLGELDTSKDRILKKKRDKKKKQKKKKGSFFIKKSTSNSSKKSQKKVKKMKKSKKSPVAAPAPNPPDLPVSCIDVDACLPPNVCDPTSGSCTPLEQTIPCVAVIDEWDGDGSYDPNPLWVTFRTEYPTRPFCLLNPFDGFSGSRVL